MSRIANLAANNQLIRYMLRTQERIFDTQGQISTGKKSQDYAGISFDAERLVGLEMSSTLLDRYKINNDLFDLRLKSAQTVVTGASITEGGTPVGGIRGSISDFKKALIKYHSGTLSDQQSIKDVQDAAFRGLQDMQNYLNTDINGEHLFAGARVNVRPVNMGLNTLSTFQTTYDGDKVHFPMVRDGNITDSFTTTNAQTGDLTFTVGSGTITSANANGLKNIPLGGRITVAGANTLNNKTYTVVAKPTNNSIVVTGTVTNTTITVPSTNAPGASETIAATIAVSGWYSGDQVSLTHRVSESRAFSYDLKASDPAFDKAIRAMGLMAQGVFGTDGGLDAHPDRVDNALALLGAALDPPGVSAPPFGPELASNITQLETDLGYHRVLIDQSNKDHTALLSHFGDRVTTLETADKLAAITKMLDDSQALEASYQSISRIRELSLINYL